MLLQRGVNKVPSLKPHLPHKQIVHENQPKVKPLASNFRAPRM